MNAVVFGGSGFIGSHVADVLTDRGFQVTLFDRVESPYRKANQKMVVGDVQDLDTVKEVVRGHNYVLNFCGIAGLGDAKDNPVLATEANILGNLKLLEAMRDEPPRRFIFASTYYVYSESGSIYRVTKQSCELFIKEYARLYGLPYSILRYGSVYGPRAGHANAIYRFLREAVEFGRITRRGRGEDFREYIHVLDAAAATHAIMVDREFENRHVILAGHQKIKVDDLFIMINEMMEGKLSINHAPAETNPHGHYTITPYTFKPDTAVRYTAETHHDLGQGMLSMMHEIYGSLNHDSLYQEKACPRWNA